MNKVAQYVIDRLKEPSSWRGLIMVGTSTASMCGAKYDLSTDQIVAIITTGVFVSGMVGSLIPDKMKASGKGVIETVTDSIKAVGDSDDAVRDNSVGIKVIEVFDKK